MAPPHGRRNIGVPQGHQGQPQGPLKEAEKQLSYSIVPGRFCCSVEYEYEYRLTPEYEYETAGTAEPGEFSPATLVVYDRN